MDLSVSHPYLMSCGCNRDRRVFFTSTKNAKKLKDISLKSVGNALTQIITKIEINTSTINPAVFLIT